MGLLKNTPFGLVFFLSLCLLMTFPGPSWKVSGVNQSVPSTWSPFGPFTQKLVIHDYGDYDVMFNAFQIGSVDITDWPLESNTQISSLCSNLDFYCTTPQAMLAYFGLEINSHTSFLGEALTTPRVLSPASFTTTGTMTGCSSGFGSLHILLQNQETSTTVLDSLNTLTLVSQPSGSPSVAVGDSGGATPSGNYVVPCEPAGSYSLRTSIYNGTGSAGTITVTITSGTVTSGTFNVNFNSPSSVVPTQNRALLGAALTHLLDDPAFVRATPASVAQAPCAFWVPFQGESCPTGTTSEYQCGGTCPAANPAGGAATQVDVAECQFNNHPWLNVVGCSTGATGHDVGPYHITDSTVNVNSLWWNTGTSGLVAGYSGHDDLRAACDDFVSMGLTLSPATATCNDVANAAELTTDPGIYAHISNNGQQIKLVIRTNLADREYGQVIADSLNFLFGTPSNRDAQTGFVGTVCYSPFSSNPCTQFTPHYFDIAHVSPVFEDTPAGSGPDSWQLYTGDKSFDFIHDEYFLYRTSPFTGSVCAPGGQPINPSNYVFWCDPQTDNDAIQGELSETPTLSSKFFQRAMIDELNKATDVPAFSPIGTFVENNGWNFQQCTSQCSSTQASLVNTVGYGTFAGNAYFTMLNARQVPGYMANAVQNQPTPGLIRRGFSQVTLNLSPFTFNSIWEKEVLSDIYDTMLKQDPSTTGPVVQLFDWGTTRHTTSFDGSAIGCNAINGCVTGVTTQTWYLRNDWKFSDGNDVTANDVAYSILSYRDVPSGPLQPFVANVVSAKGLDCAAGQACKQLQVKLQGLVCQNSGLVVPCLNRVNPTTTVISIQDLLDSNIGLNVYVLEKSLWSPYCGDPPTPGGTCASPSFDPMYPSANSPGIEVGPGPWSCITPIAGTGVSAGHVGGPCTESATGVLTGQAVNVDGTIILQENTFSARCCPTGSGAAATRAISATIATSSSLYRFSYADHNNDGVVNILDLADVASHFGTADPYWVNPNIATGSTVNVQDLATVAFEFGDSMLGGWSAQQLVGIDPQIDPFFCPTTGC